MSNQCHLCENSNTQNILDLGLVPIAHRYRKTADLNQEYKSQLAINVCPDCAFIQIHNPVPASELYKDYNFCFSTWKPQPHMQDEVELLKEILPLDSVIVEIGSNDGSFLKLLKDAGFKNLIGIEPNTVSTALARQAGITVIEGFFEQNSAAELLSKVGRADVIIARQVIEHIPNLTELMKHIKQVLQPSGWILFEVPDFEVPLQYGDCSQLWEEHVNYFTEPVMKYFLNSFGFEAKTVKRFPFSGGALMVLAQQTSSKKNRADFNDEITKIKELSGNYRNKVAENQANLLGILEQNKKNNIPNILYGTGCRANAFLNGLKLNKYFDLIVDDQIEKIGHYMPGSTMEIKPSTAIYENIGCCFLSVNVENEKKVIERHQQYAALGGKFYSVNSPSELYFLFD
jgi:SAM-dependent methyltransferase